MMDRLRAIARPARRREPAAPLWAQALLSDVCAEAGVAQPTLTWRSRAHHHSTGLTRRSDALIAVRAGRDELDQRLTLLHELAHWLSPPGRNGRRAVHHGRVFYAIAFRLYADHRIPSADALRLESGRYPSALRHAAALDVPGASALLAGRRDLLRARPRRTWRVLVAEHPIRLARAGRWRVCSTCGQRVVGRHLARVLRGRRIFRHTLLTSEPASS